MPSVILETVGRFLVEYGLLGVLVTMPPAMLLTLGFRMKRRWTLFPSGGLFLSVGCAILGLTLEGISTGEVLALSRSTLTVAQAGHPVFFWVSTVAFLFGSLAIAGLGLFLLGRACFPLNTPAHSDPAKADRSPLRP